MNHSRASEMMNAFLDGELTNAEARELQAHLEECGSCNAEVAELRHLTGDLHSLGAQHAPTALRSRVIDAIAESSGAGRLNSAFATAARRRVGWAAFAAVLILVALFLWPHSNTYVENALAKTDAAIAQASTVHMICKWYRPENRRETFTQREIWLAGPRGRWDEAVGTSAVLDSTGVLVVRKGSGAVPSSASVLVQHHSLEPMLIGLAKLHGAGVRLEHPAPVMWQGRTYDVLVSRDRDKDGSLLRTIFMLDPSTALPVHGEVEKQVDGRWEPEALMNFEFNKPIDQSVFSL